MVTALYRTDPDRSNPVYYPVHPDGYRRCCYYYMATKEDCEPQPGRNY